MPVIGSVSFPTSQIGKRHAIGLVGAGAHLLRKRVSNYGSIDDSEGWFDSVHKCRVVTWLRPQDVRIVYLI